MVKIRRVADIYIKGILPLNAYDGVAKVRSRILETGITCHPVIDNGKLVGLVTAKSLLTAHPNRIVADAMVREPHVVPAETPVWQAKEVFEESGADALLVKEEGQLRGVLPRDVFNANLGAHRDLLTGLYKSDYIYYQGARLLEKGHEICIIFVDINNFGLIDKMYGHALGDIVLMEVSRLLNENVPPEAFLCRFGGDEFVVLLSAKLDEGIACARRLVEVIERHTFANGIEVSISAGIIGGRRQKLRAVDPWQTIENLLNMASLRSTEAKKNNTQLSIAEIYSSSSDEIA